MDENIAARLREEFGYAPDESDGEKWVVYRDNMLIVTHHRNKPKLFERGCRGDYIEIEPDLRGVCY